MTKRARTAGAPRKTGNVGSEENVAPVHPWTKEEMEAAKPLPLPAVEAPAKPSAAGHPHAGKGQMTPGGPPEDDSSE